MTSTATRAGLTSVQFVGQKAGNITFKDQTHEEFYSKTLPRCRRQDVYHKALVYCLGMCEDTRNNVDEIYDFTTGSIRTECLSEGWMTGSNAKVIRMAFNLYCNGTPSVYDYDDAEQQLKECRYYTVEDLFCCEYAPYFWEAIKIRYPEYCSYLCQLSASAKYIP